MQPILVTVAVLSTFTTALLLRFSEPITFRVERLLPGRFRRLLTIYESWVEGLRQRPVEAGRGVTLMLRAVLLDLVAAALIVLAFRAWRAGIEGFLIAHFHFGPQLVHTVTTMVLGLALLPVFVVLVLLTRKLARRLAARVFPDGDSNSSELVQATLVFAVVLALGVVGAGMLAPVVGAEYVWLAFALSLTATFALVWKRAGAVDDEITSAGALLMKAIAEQGLPEAERETQVPPLLPSNLREVTLAPGDFAVGQTLATLRLRSVTGASVLALRDSLGQVESPTGAESLAPGDTLFVAGCQLDQDAATRLLTTGAHHLL